METIRALGGRVTTPTRSPRKPIPRACRMRQCHRPAAAIAVASPDMNGLGGDSFWLI